MHDIFSLLTEMEPGLIANMAYDTAWIVRLGDTETEMSAATLEWICDNQFPDGSWGAKRYGIGSCCRKWSYHKIINTGN